MKLVEALALKPNSRVAFVGAGGKSTAIFRLARQARGRVIVTASANLGLEQAAWADTHVVIRSPGELEPLIQSLPEGVTLLTGEEKEEHKLSGLTPELLEHARRLAGAHNAPLLVEADGSRRRPLKAPAGHEPPLPAFVDTVVVVAGLSGVGQPLDEEWVHRPEVYGRLAGLAPGETVTAAAAARVLNHPQGGLKAIPEEARKIVVLNQADSAEQAALARRMSAALLGVYDQVVVSRLSEEGGEEVLAVHQKVAGIVLAAGESSRMETPKQVLPWRGKPFVHAVAETALQAGLDPVVVVTGAHRKAVEEALAGLGVTLIHNPTWPQGQSSSVKSGLAVLPKAARAAVFFLVDMPQTPVSLVEALVNTHAATLAPIVAPMIGPQRGNPVLFDRTTFPDFGSIEGDAGGRQVFARYKITPVPWVDEAAALDVDTPEDYARLLNFE